MNFFAKCLAVFLGLTTVLVILDRALLDLSHTLAGSILFSATISLLAALIFGWVEDVYIEHRQPY